MSYFPKPSLNENDLAIIERGDTAAHSIEAGQYVSWHGRTGKAKAAILQGATLDDMLFDYDEDGVLNASLTQLDIPITPVNDAYYNVSDDNYCYIQDNVVTLKMNITKTKSSQVIATIPSAYAPSSTICFTCNYWRSNDIYPNRCFIYPNGDIEVATATTSSTFFIFAQWRI